MLARLAVASCFSLAVSACDTAAPTTGSERSPEPAAATPAVEPAGPAAPERETIESAVTWPAAAHLDAQARAALPEPALAKIAESPVPALAPRQSELATLAIVSVGPAFYALSAPAGDITVSIHATRVAHRYPSIQPVKGDQTLRGTDARLTQNEGIWSVSWLENGVAYVVEAECAVLSDPRCQSGDYVMKVAEELAYVGGRGH